MSEHFDFERRRQLAESAKTIGIRPTAHLFHTRPGTVKKWLRIHQQDGLSGIAAHVRIRRPFPSLTNARLVECRQDRVKAKTVRGDEWIACLECGRLLKRIDRQHLRGKTCTGSSLTVAAYKEKWGYNRKASLCSVKASLAWRARAKKHGLAKLGRGTRFTHGESRGGGLKMRPEGLLNVRRPDGARADKQRGRDWVIAQLRLAGKDEESIAKAVGISATAIRFRLKRMRFPSGRGPFAFEHGRVVTAEAVSDVLKASGLTAAELTRIMGRSKASLHHHLRKPGEPIPIVLAIATKQAARALPRTTSGGRPAVILSGERSRLREAYRELAEDLTLLRAWLKSEKRTVARMQDWICNQTRLGTIRRLLFWPEFFQWIDPLVLLGSKWRVKETARDFLAEDYGVSARTVDSIIFG